MTQTSGSTFYQYPVYEPSGETFLYAVLFLISCSGIPDVPSLILSTAIGAKLLWDACRYVGWFSVTRKGVEGSLRVKQKQGYRRDGKIFVPKAAPDTILRRHYNKWGVENTPRECVGRYARIPEHAIPMSKTHPDEQYERLAQYGEVQFLIRCQTDDRGEIFLIADDHARSLYLLNPID